ncbi:hypothetical protein [Kribbella sp. VKM Ac-2569]|uniref:hypothetical protein n=1 Tax=Kribbella sp. VKM Ac-2569 TaxID=2512220 RepID=UPI00102B59CF|nr:hypothetical protein [Kribbella sp. VKM Ac-2569]
MGKQQGRWIRWAIPVLVGMVCLGVGLFAGQRIDSDSWSALGEWLGATGTAAAVVAALYIANREADASRNRAIAEARERNERALAERLALQRRGIVEAREREERAREEARELEERARADALEREQREAEAARQQGIRDASLVLGEVEAPPFDPQNISPEWWMVMKNYASHPAVQPRLETFLHPAGGTTDWTFDDPAGMFEDYRVPDHLAPSGGEERLPVDVSYKPPLDPEQARRWLPVPIFSYTDLQGRRWRRIGTSLPVEVDPRDTSLLSGPDWYQAVHPGVAR